MTELTIRKSVALFFYCFNKQQNVTRRRRPGNCCQTSIASSHQEKGKARASWKTHKELFFRSFRTTISMVVSGEIVEIK